MVTERQRFLDSMEYRPSDRVPNHELCAWPQALAEWRRTNEEARGLHHWFWMVREDFWGLDVREPVPINFGLMPAYDTQVIEETDAYRIFRDGMGRTRKELKQGMLDGVALSMDQYLDFPLRGPDDWPDMRRRLQGGIPERLPADLVQRAAAWQKRDHVLVLGENGAANGFYWRARDMMGTEALSFAWYDYPQMMHEIMEWYTEFIIETTRPVLELVQPEYFLFNEDLSAKPGPLLSPKTYRTFIHDRRRRIIDFVKGMGVKYVIMDSDGDPTKLLGLMLDEGIDGLLPIERAAGVSPQGLRQQFGKSLRLWGGVDKRVLAQGPEAIKAHLREMIPLIEEGGFIPTVDHCVPPDVSWDNMRYYMDAKQALLCGDFAKLE
jgi:uroporphyrinogen decarboxylase